MYGYTETTLYPSVHYECQTFFSLQNCRLACIEESLSFQGTTTVCKSIRVLGRADGITWVETSRAKHDLVMKSVHNFPDTKFTG